MVYENPDEYNSDQERRRSMLKAAIEFMEKKKADKKEIDMDSEDIVNAAKKFDGFITDS